MPSAVVQHQQPACAWPTACRRRPRRVRECVSGVRKYRVRLDRYYAGYRNPRATACCEYPRERREQQCNNIMDRGSWPHEEAAVHECGGSKSCKPIAQAGVQKLGNDMMLQSAGTAADHSGSTNDVRRLQRHFANVAYALARRKHAAVRIQRAYRSSLARPGVSARYQHGATLPELAVRLRMTLGVEASASPQYLLAKAYCHLGVRPPASIDGLRGRSRSWHASELKSSLTLCLRGVDLVKKHGLSIEVNLPGLCPPASQFGVLGCSKPSQSAQKWTRACATVCGRTT